MRVLIFSWRDLAHPLAGGAEVYTDEVAQCWVAKGHEVTLFTSSMSHLRADEDRNGIRIIRRGGRHSVYREARRFYEFEARGKFDLVIDQINTRPFLCPRFASDVPVLALVHQVAREVWFYETLLPLALLGRFVLEPLWLRTYRDVPTATVSTSSRRSLERYGLRNVTVVPEGFSSKCYGSVPTREDLPTMIYVGRLSRNKRPHHVLRAFRRVRKAIPNAQLWILGSGPLERALQKHDHEGVTFFGRVGEETKHKLLSRAHVWVLTSVREGWGLTVTEAASVGTPTVAYNVAGLCDSVSASGGVLTQPRPRALADAVVRVLSRDLHPQSVGANGVIPWQAVADRLFELALRCVEKSANRQPSYQEGGVAESPYPILTER
jgi:glycosyltransferase involved in cell wall biosynthesis